jgi:hypothetical protein
MAVAVDESNREVWMEVSDEVVQALEVAFKKATEERVSEATLQASVVRR